ncbi:MAG: hypothetical protein RLZZ19_851, partial [Actinomycetota bacterium]
RRRRQVGGFVEPARWPRTPAAVALDVIDMEQMCGLRAHFGGNRQAAICREITKTYEETVRGSLDELCEWSTSKEMLGEFTLVIGGYENSDINLSDADIAEMVRRNESSGITRKEAIAMTAKELRLPKRKVFDIMVTEK